MFVQLLLFYFKVPHHFRNGAFVNLFFILAVVGGSLVLQVSKEKKLYPFATNFKNSLKNAGTYIILVACFIFIYLKYINPEFLENYRQLRIEMALAEDFDKIQNIEVNVNPIENYLKV